MYLFINIIKTHRKAEPVPMTHGEMDVHLSGLLPSPPPYYNFKQLPLVRGLDPYWLEKMKVTVKCIPAEPLGDIHMPNSSLFRSCSHYGLFIAAFGFIYQGHYWILAVIGFGHGLLSMFVRSFKDDLWILHSERRTRKRGGWF